MKSADTLKIVLPAILGFAVSGVVFHKILDRYPNVAIRDTVHATLPTLPRGSMVNLSSGTDEYDEVVTGKVLLVFLTIDCDACKTEVSNLVQAVPSLSSSVRVYGVYIEPRDKVGQFIENTQINFPVLLDNGGAILARLGFKFMPTKILLDDGRIKRIWYGSSASKDELLKDVSGIDSK